MNQLEHRTTDAGRLASAALESELLDEVHKYRIVVWLDKDGHYDTFADDLAARHAAGSFPHPVLGFRGSFLELMLALEPFENGLDREALIVHLPGHTETSVKETPLLELYLQGKRFRKALPTLVREVATGLAAPAEVETFVGAPDLSLAKADAWLGAASAAPKGGLALFLARMSDTALLGELLTGSAPLLAQVTTPADAAALRAALLARTGMDAAWCTFYLGGPDNDDASAIAAAWAGYLLAMEFVHDLKRAPRTTQLLPLKAAQPPIVDACRVLVQHLRAAHVEEYKRIARAAEAPLASEQQGATAADLGRIDTFPFEARIVLEDAVRALGSGEWTQVLGWAEDRRDDKSFWIRHEIDQRREWELVIEAARLGATIAEARKGIDSLAFVSDAVSYYTEQGWKVDQAHRQFEQKRSPELYAGLPHHAEFFPITTRLRTEYRSWADTLARKFATLCTQERWALDSSLRQRDLFVEDVEPLVKAGERVAFFVVDAFRFELGKELVSLLEKDLDLPVKIRARLAELPTVTEVGMNALAPVAHEGLLSPVINLDKGKFSGFRGSGFTVSSPDTRAESMGLRAIGASPTKYTLKQIVEMPLESLKKSIAASQKLLFIHSLEFDNAGEAGFGLRLFPDLVAQLKTAFHQLERAGVKCFVFTADHGFLLQDTETTRVEPFGKKLEPDRRHVLVKDAQTREHMVPVALQDLGYGDTPGYLLLQDDTAVYARAGGVPPFVHGGNSLQERVIPVIVAHRARAAGKSATAYELHAERLPPAMGHECIKVKVDLARQISGSLGFAGADKISIALRVVDRPDVVLTLAHAPPPAIREGETALVPVRHDVTLYFTLASAASGERVRIEIYHPDRTQDVTSCRLGDYFDVVYRPIKTPSVLPGAAVVVVSSPDDWLAAIADPSLRDAIAYIAKHGAINEVELFKMLGSARKMRTFNDQLDAVREKLPFVVLTMTDTGMRRWVREIG